MDWGDFVMTKECFQAIESLRMNEDIIITKPDKGSGVVILNKNEYNDKMMTILNDTTKFLDLGQVTSNDNTAKIETQIQRRLLQLNKGKINLKNRVQSNPTHCLPATAHVRPSKNSQERCTLTSNSVNDRIGPA